MASSSERRQDEHRPAIDHDPSTAVAVTGATGFVGRHVVAELERRGVSPTLVVRPGSPVAPPMARRRVVPIDLLDPPAGAYQMLGSPEILIHLAWGGLPHYTSSHHLERELPAQRAFLGGLLADGLPALTVTGTCFEYGMQAGLLSEDLPAAPVTAYARAKDELRRTLDAARAERAFSFTWLRLFYLRGEGQAPGSLIPQLEAAIARGDRAFEMSGGEQLRDYLPVDEAARLITILALDRGDNGIVNVCSGRPVTIRSIAEAVVEEHGASIELKLGALPYPAHEPMAFWGDRRKLDRLIRME